ncbi:MAG: PGPGW domain-containing protein [Candidatus Acidiferrales bacterium]
MTKAAWRLGRIILGFALLGLGVIGLFLPILQGVAMIVAGLLLLAPEFQWARRLLDWAKRKWHSVRDTAAGAGE